METSLQIGNIAGIPVKIHWSFLLVIPLFAWIIGSQIVLTTELIRILFGVPIDATHEVAHSLIAKAKGIKIHGITLLILGGVSQMEEVVPDPKVELPMALAGPLTSLAIGIICSALVYVFPVLPDPAVAGVLIFTFGYLGILNVLLFAFNLLPVFGIFGFLMLNPILILIAFFIYIGANQEATFLRYYVLLQDVTVADAMSNSLVTVEPETPLPRLLELMYETKHLGFPVVERGNLVGIVTLSDIHKVSPIDREAMQVRDVMTRDPITLPPSAPLIDALRIMTTHGIGRIPVVDDGDLVGIVTRTDVLRVMELREKA